MSEFFESEVVRAEMAEISEMQEEVYGHIFDFEKMCPEDQKYHVDLLDRLLNKQQILYTRLSLSDDPKAKQMKEDICKAAVQMGFPGNVDMRILFQNMTQAVGMMKQHIDNCK